jgi:hypothetical protein
VHRLPCDLTAVEGIVIAAAADDDDDDAAAVGFAGVGKGSREEQAARLGYNTQ